MSARRTQASILWLLLAAALACVTALASHPAGAQLPGTPVFPTPPPTDPFPTIPPDVPSPAPHSPTPTLPPPTESATPTMTATAPATATDEPTPTTLPGTVFSAYAPYTARNDDFADRLPTPDGGPGSDRPNGESWPRR